MNFDFHVIFHNKKSSIDVNNMMLSEQLVLEKTLKQALVIYPIASNCKISFSETLSLSSFTHRNSKSPIATHDKIQK
jgi:hypothetical protein